MELLITDYCTCLCLSERVYERLPKNKMPSVPKTSLYSLLLIMITKLPPSMSKTNQAQL